MVFIPKILPSIAFLNFTIPHVYGFALTHAFLFFLSACISVLYLVWWTKYLLSLVSSHGRAFSIYALLCSPSFDSFNFSYSYGFHVFPFFYMANTLRSEIHKGLCYLRRRRKIRKRNTIFKM